MIQGTLQRLASGNLPQKLTGVARKVRDRRHWTAVEGGNLKDTVGTRAAYVQTPPKPGPKATTGAPGPRPGRGPPQLPRSRREAGPRLPRPAPLRSLRSAPPRAAAHAALAPTVRKAWSRRTQRQAARKGNAPSRTTQSRPFCTFVSLATTRRSPLRSWSRRAAPQDH